MTILTGIIKESINTLLEWARRAGASEDFFMRLDCESLVQIGSGIIAILVT